MSDLVGTTQWQSFKNLMRDAHDTFHQKEVVWKRQKSQMDRWGEDNIDNGYDSINLKVLINYNYRRSWPVTFRTETGDQDRESMQLLINKQYLSELGYLNGAGYFDFNPSDDYFVIDGLNHISMGDTPISQAQSTDILISIIVKREDTLTHIKR